MSGGGGRGGAGGGGWSTYIRGLYSRVFSMSRDLVTRSTRDPSPARLKRRSTLPEVGAGDRRWLQKPADRKWRSLKLSPRYGGGQGETGVKIYTWSCRVGGLYSREDGCEEPSESGVILYVRTFCAISSAFQGIDQHTIVLKKYTPHFN